MATSYGSRDVPGQGCGRAGRNRASRPMRSSQVLRRRVRPVGVETLCGATKPQPWLVLGLPQPIWCVIRAALRRLRLLALRQQLRVVTWALLVPTRVQEHAPEPRLLVIIRDIPRGHPSALSSKSVLLHKQVRAPISHRRATSLVHYQ
eukprot:COSAG02_NODE_3730_length_6312_cov_289.526799_1_plen_148_part_00